MQRVCFVGLVIALVLVFVASPGRAADSNGAPVCTIAGDQTRPVMVSDGSGGAIIAWHDARSGTGNGVVYAQRISAGGVPQWAAGGIPLSTTGDVNDPVIVADGAGGAFVAFGGAGTHPRAQHVDASGTLGWGTDGVALSTSTTARELSIAPDLGGAGGAIVAWREDNGAGGTSDVDAQKVNAGGATLWSAGGLPVANSNTFNETLPAVLSDGAGGAFVTFVTSAGGVRILRINPVGTPQWSQVPLVSNANNNVPVIVSDGSGGAIVAWAGGGGLGTATQRVSATGTRMWSPQSSGVPLSTNGTLPNLIGDGGGGAVIVWQDFRSGTNLDLYAQYVNSAGVALWMNHGTPVCMATQDQRSPAIVPDGSGGSIITWYDERIGSQWDIYAQRLDGNGSPLWAVNGVPVCTLPSTQDYPAIASDGAGGAFVTWEDQRAGNWDVYASRLGGSGVLLQVPENPGVGASLRAWPDPFVGRVQLGFALPVAAEVRMDVLDVAGRTVRSVDAGRLEAGSHVLAWDGRTDEGRRAGGGIYFLRVHGPGVALARTVVRLR